jgi:hypothetical protein
MATLNPAQNFYPLTDLAAATIFKLGHWWFSNRTTGDRKQASNDTDTENRPVGCAEFNTFPVDAVFGNQR